MNAGLWFAATILAALTVAVALCSWRDRGQR